MSLVVDACVLRSAGDSGKPAPANCRAVLEEILRAEKIVSVDGDLMAEWRRHRSRYSSTWMVSMFSRRLIDQRSGFSGKATSVEGAVSKLSEPQLSVARKDMHLLKIAVDCDYQVVSCEKKCRAAFHVASVFCSEIRKVFWLYPDEDDCCLAVSGAIPCPRSWRLDSP